MPSSQTLPTRKLGKYGPQVPALGFGLMGLSAFYGSTEPDSERFKVLDRAYELGATNWDSADVYLDSEDLVGKWFARTGKRDEIFLATKFAFKTGVVDSSPEYCKKACEDSLKRLQTSWIDLYYCHRVDEVTPIEKTVEAMVELKNEGKIKYLGLSEISANTLRRACKVHHIDAVELEYSPFCLDIESPQWPILKAARELGVAVVAYSPLGRGFVTGAYTSRADFQSGDFRLTNPRFSEENFPKNLVLAEKIVSLATKKGCTASQLTLAWLLAQGDDIIPIPGTKKIKYLEENLGALKVVLSEEEKKEIRQLAENAEVFGERYAEQVLLYREAAPLQE